MYINKLILFSFDASTFYLGKNTSQNVKDLSKIILTYPVSHINISTTSVFLIAITFKEHFS